jgi:hypothetical protein
LESRNVEAVLVPALLVADIATIATIAPEAEAQGDTEAENETEKDDDTEVVREALATIENANASEAIVTEARESGATETESSERGNENEKEKTLHLLILQIKPLLTVRSLSMVPLRCTSQLTLLLPISLKEQT